MPDSLRVPFTDLFVNSLSADEVASYARTAISRKERKRLVANINLHGLYLYTTEPMFNLFTRRADLVVIDGFPVWIACALRYPGRVAIGDRVGSTDWLDSLFSDGEPMRVWAVGGSSSASGAAKRELTTRFPHLTWTATDGYQELRELTHERIEDLSRVDLLLVGMGMPLQESWVVENWPFIHAHVIANVGGYLDYYAGEQDLAPRWLGALGGEWLYRLAKSPRRLAYRYLVEPWKLMATLPQYSKGMRRRGTLRE